MYLPEEVKEERQRNVISRLQKIEGQIRGLQGMVTGGQECEAMLTQLRAAQSALKSVTALVLKSYLVKCSREMAGENDPAGLYHKLEKTGRLLTKFIGA